MPSATLQLVTPRISVNQLGEFAFSTPSKKKRILQDSKFGNKITSPYYKPCEEAILRAFDGHSFDLASLEADRLKILQRAAPKPQHKARWENNAAMLSRLAQVEPAARPDDGAQNIVRRNALIQIDGVCISVRPEIVTTRENGLFSYTKFRFSTSKVSLDASELVLLVLLKFGQQESRDGRQIDPEHTKIIDCFNKTIIVGHTLHRVREHQLNAALREIIALWPTITPPNEPLSDLQLAS